jgi:hypothetical protein
MVVKEIFAKDISRPINGVVKVDQRNEEVIWQELDEYVVTKEIQKHLHQFIKAYLLSIDNPETPAITDNMGVWVSGFFGSGKSHFIKILSYLLGNIEVRNPETGTTKRVVSFFEQKIPDPVFYADIKRAASQDTDVILFNIDSKANHADGKAAILSVFWRLFNEIQGFSKDSLELAEMERYLTKKGKFEKFCETFEEIQGSSWNQERDSFMLHQDEIVQALSKILGKSQEATGSWFDEVIHKTPKTIEAFASQVKEYLGEKGNNHRIVFLSDEMGQFIGEDTSLMLNLQTITEDLGRLCAGKAWIIVTSQEAIDSVLQNLKGAKANDFSKIKGRFKTKISLSSSNTDEVIQERLLQKTPDATKDLKGLFKSKGDILKNQLSFTADCATLTGFTDTESFSKNYPFVPYHFQILQKVFESIRKTGFTGKHLSQGERSMLDAFQSSAIDLGGREIGALAPLYGFYPCIESFLDTSVKRSIDQASEKVTMKPLDIQLLQALFLIRHVTIIKPNIDNLATLCIDEVDADRIALKKSIGDSLARLEHEHLINSSGGHYYFLTNEEREVSQEIKSIKVTSSEENNLLREIIFDEILKDKNKYRYPAFKRDYPFNRLCDGIPHKGKTDQDLTIDIITPMNDDVPSDQAHFIMYSAGHKNHLVIRLSDEPSLSKEVTGYKQTEKYIQQKHDASLSPTMKEINKNLAEDNRQRRGRITQLLGSLIMQADYYAMGSQLEIKASSPQTAIENGLDELIPNVYKKFHYLQELHDEPMAEIKEVLKSDDLALQQLEMFMQEHAVPMDLKEVMEYVSMLHAKDKPIVLSDVVDYFSSIPYGWPEWEVVLLVARLYMGSKIYLIYEGSKLMPDQAFSPLTKSAQQKNLKIMERAHIKPADIKKARDLGKELFGMIGPEGQENIFRFLMEELEKWHVMLIPPKSLADTGAYPGKDEIDAILKLVQKLLSINDSFEFLKAFLASREEFLSAHDDLRDIKDFYTNQKSTWESLKKAADEFKPNRPILEKDAEAAKNLEKMDQILQAPRPYGVLSSSAALIADLREKNDALLTTERANAVAELDALITQVKTLLDEKKADGDLRNKTLHPIQTLKAAIEKEGGIPNIQYIVNVSAQSSFEEAVSLIESYGKPPIEGKKPLKPVKDIKVSVFAAKQYLETESDVDEYVETLRKKLLEALKGGNRVRIK